MLSHAFCILPALTNFPQGPFAEYKAVPVYIDNWFWTLGIGPGVANTEETEAVLTALDIINSAATNAPRLYFAGYVDAGLYNSPIPPPMNMTGGILIRTFGDCDKEAIYAVSALAIETHGNGSEVSTIAFRRGGNFACNTLDWYIDPSLDGGYYNDSDAKIDVIGVLVHEILHSLNLGHTNDIADSDNCSVAHPRTSSVAAVMFAGDSYSRLWRRRLKRDDIEGLRYLYGGAPARPFFFTQSTSVTPPSAGSWAASAELQPGLVSNTPVSLTDATRDLDELMWAGFTDANDGVRIMMGDWTGWAGNPVGGTAIFNFTIPATPAKTWERSVVARGVPASETLLSKSREIVAWFAGTSVGFSENTNTLDVGIQYKIRREGTWQLPQSAGIATKNRSMGMSYDPRWDVFVLAYIDVCMPGSPGTCGSVADLPAYQRVFVRTIEATTGNAACTQALTTSGQVLAVGDVSCDFRSLAQDSFCKIPVSTTDTAGPKLRIIEGTISTVSDSPCFVRSALPDPPLTLSLRSLGAPSSAMNGLATNGAMLVGYTPHFTGAPAADGYARIFTMDRTAAGAMDGVVDNAHTFQTWFWPLHVGTMNRVSGGGVKWRAITY